MAVVLTPMDAVNVFVSNLQKKHRNLGKRKSKLDHYKETLSKGETLNEEQKKAVEGYESVMQSIAVVQEILLQSKELVADVERAAQHCETQAELSREQHTQKFLRTQICLMQLINGLDNSDLRTAIIKASSTNHLRMLDTIRNLFASPVIVNWPGTNSTCLSSAPEFLQSQECLESPAQHLYNFVLGRSVQIPIPEGYDGPLRKFNFKEARALCFRLLANPAVQRSLGAPCTTNEQAPNHEGTKFTPSLPANNVNYDVHGLCTYSDGHSNQTPLVSVVEPDIPRKMTERPQVPTDTDRAVKPPGGTFNFIQASKVISPDPDAEFPTDRAKIQPLNHPNEDVTYPASVPAQHVDLISVPYGGSYNNTENTYGLQADDAKDDSKPYINSVESAKSVPASDAEVESNAYVPSKPTSFADLFRRQGYNNQTISRRDPNIKPKTDRASTTVGAETSDLVETAEDPGSTRQAGANRARGGSCSFRGGRGFGRGSMASSRRPYGGGPRLSRGGAHSGRGRTFQGPRTNVAQA